MSIIKSFSVGNGDMYYIKHGADSFTIIDCNLHEPDKRAIVDELIVESKGKSIVRFISTHPDEDHICGLDYLDGRMKLVNFYCVENSATKDEPTASFNRYCDLRDSSKAFYLEKGCRRCWLNRADKENQHDGAGISILWPDTGNAAFAEALEDAAEGKSPNNISPIIRYSLEDGVTAVWMGDLERDFMEKVEGCVELGPVDVLFAPHHGRKTGRPPKSWMVDMDPGLVVIGEADSDVLDYYQGYTHICQNTAGDILFDCVSGYVHVYAMHYCSVDGLLDLERSDNRELCYVGSLPTRS